MKYPFHDVICDGTTPSLPGVQKGRQFADGAFTLVELLTVLAIIAILCAFAVPGYLSWLPKYRLNRAADDMLVLFQNARLRAIKENADVYIDFDPDGDGNADGNYVVSVDRGQDGQEKSIATGRLGRSVNLEEVEFAGGGGGVKYMHFTHRGLATGGHIIISNKHGKAKKIVTSRTGNIHQEDLG